MSLTRHDVENIAHLARLSITEAELSVYVDSLSKILNFVEQLATVNTDSVEPMAHPLAGQVQRMREDEVLDQDRHETGESAFQGRAGHGPLQQPELREGGEPIIMIIERPDRRHRVVAAQRAVRRLPD